LALFGKKSKPLGPGVIHTEDEIWGYLDEIFRLRNTLTLRTKNKQWQCNIYFVDMTKKILRIEDSAGLSEFRDKAIQCGFSMDSTWFVFQSKLIYSGGKPHVILPAAIKHHERRKNPRVNISHRENVRVSVLQSLGAGIGITGKAVNVSIDGICIKIERAINLQNEQNVSIRPDLLPKGTELMIVKVNRIPGVPSFEAPAVVQWISPYGGGKLAVRFPKIPGAFKTAIDNFVKSRFLPYRPTRRSYKRRQDMEKEREIDKQKKEEEQQQNLQEAEEQKKPVKNGPVTFVSDAVPEAETPAESPEPGTKMEEVPGEVQVIVPPELEETPPPEPEVEEPKTPILLSLGQELKDSLSFLENVDGYEWIHAESPMRIIKFVRERKRGFLFLPPEYKRQSMLEYLEKMSSMGILSNIIIIIISGEPIPPKDLIKCRMLGIEHTFQLPLESSHQVLNVISAADSLIR
jgi:hypothetical protein